MEKKRHTTFSEETDNKHKKLHVRKKMQERRQRRNIFKVLKEKTNCQLRKQLFRQKPK